MSPDETHARQRLIPGWDQDRVRAATAVVVGLGALGNEVAKNLALLGIGRLILCDRDTVSSSNLSRTALFTPSDVDRPKVAAAAAGLARLAPRMPVETRFDDLAAGVGLGELADADIVLGCLDSRHARLALLGRCSLVGARLVDGGTHPWGGEVRVRTSAEDACYGCSLTSGQRTEQDRPAHCDDLAEAPQPSSIISTSLVASWMTVAAARIIQDLTLPWRFLEISALASRTGPVTVPRDQTCPHHRPLGEIELAEFSHLTTVGQALETLMDSEHPLTWVFFPRPGMCYHCSHTCEADYVQRSSVGTCPACGRWVRHTMSQELRTAPRELPLSSLGVPPEEILTVRSAVAEGGYRWLRLKRSANAPATPNRSRPPNPTSS